MAVFYSPTIHVLSHLARPFIYYCQYLSDLGAWAFLITEQKVHRKLRY